MRTVEPAGVILVGPHGCVFAQCAKDGRVCSHKIDVDAGVQLAICQNRVSIREIKRGRQMNLRKMSSFKSETKEIMLCIFSESMEKKYDDNERHVLIKAETLFNLGS